VVRRALTLCLVLLALACSHAGKGDKPMTVPSKFLPAREIQEHAGAAASTMLPDEVAETFPVPVRAGDGVALLILFYRELGPPARRVVYPPDHAMHVDPATGKVIRFWATTPEELGIQQPSTPVPGAGVDPRMPVDELIALRKRFLDISADVWRAFAQGGGQPPDAAVRPLVKEYHEIFLRLTKREVAPFYVGAAPDFFSWVRSAAAAP
jgi:hypothetical protein